MNERTTLPVRTAELSNARLIVFALSQLILWAAHVSVSGASVGNDTVLADPVQAAIILEVSFALPVIQQDFKISEADVQWVVASYMLTWVRLAAQRLLS
jgi:hypothetical protein